MLMYIYRVAYMKSIWILEIKKLDFINIKCFGINFNIENN